jgi:pimeloyl-ACP methyl ester carboxylesterase
MPNPIPRPDAMTMTARLFAGLLVLTIAATSTAQVPAKKKVEFVKPTAEQREKVRKAVAELNDALTRPVVQKTPTADRIADVEVFLIAVSRLDRLDEYATNNDINTALDLSTTGLARSRDLLAGQAPWTSARGSIVRGYRSKVDGSVQPYAIEIPEGRDLNKPARLDVVLHGRTSNSSEIPFIRAHDGKKVPTDRAGLTLHVFGRGNNAYRWAGETDVFEAIEAVKRNYNVDNDRVVLRGFSMGGAGAWHLGLHHPALWSSVEAGAGFTETLKYAKIDTKTLPDWRLKATHIYDSIDYALNAFDVPIVGYGGENDAQLQASTNMVEALKSLGVTFKVDELVTTAEGLDFRRIVGKGMGHRVDPASETLMRAFHDEHARAGVDRTPKRIRFVTYTLAYNTAAWLSVERLVEGYKRTTVEAELENEVATIKTDNVAVLAVDRQVAETIRLDGQVLPLRAAAKALLPKVYYRRFPEGWQVVDHEPSIAMINGLEGFKSPATHGPIDDAFRGPFLVVIPTGTPWHPEVEAWAKARREQFVADWEKWLRGQVRTKRDLDVTADDIEAYHLILFGDPGSNSILARTLKGLPISWTKQTFKLDTEYDAATHVPVLIAPNPINPRRYVVVNSGHTFEPTDFIGTNALLFPRLGDYAVIRLDGKAGTSLTSGYFEERWRIGP